jgi:hypothetical protein
MAEDALERYLAKINTAYLRGDATEDTHGPRLDHHLDLARNSS